MSLASRRLLPQGLIGPFLLIAVPLLLLQLAVSWLFYREAENRFDAEIRLEQSHHLQGLSDDLQSEIDHAVDELRFLADQVRLHKALFNDEGRKQLGEDFLSFMNTTHLFDQVRLLDGRGMELVRANFNGGHPYLVPEAELQGKSGRYYFQRAHELSAGTVYLSRLDLNIENGKVEEPYKPMLRLATAVENRDGQNGMLVLNYRADVILHRLQAPDQRDAMLVNADGFPLRASEKHQSWKHFLAQDAAFALAQQQPHLWQAMLAHSKGDLRASDGDYYFYDRINMTDHAARLGQPRFPVHAEEQWYLLIRYPAAAIEAKLAHLQGGMIAFNLASGAIILLLALLAANNIRRRRLAFGMLQASERRLRSIYEQTPLGYLCLNEHGVICELNDVAAAIFAQPAEALVGTGLEALVGYCPDPHLTDESLQRECEISNSGGSHWIELRCRAVTGERGEVRQHCLLSDISGRKEREHAKLQLARLQATETLSGGIAHLINNYMAIISGNTDLLAGHTKDNAAVTLLVERIRNTAFKTSDLANDMLNYSRRGTPFFEPCEPAEVIHQSMVPTMQDDPRIHLEIAESLQPVQGDPDRLTQVLRTLLRNAIEAVDEDGHIVVVARMRAMSSEEAAAFAGMRPGAYVEIRVEDDGCGASAEVQEHLFEPFFSTKFPGRGLSLAAAYGIIKMHGGYLYVQSEEGKGSRFTIFLPVMAADSH